MDGLTKRNPIFACRRTDGQPKIRVAQKITRNDL